MDIAVLYRKRRWFHYDLDWRDAFLNFKNVNATALAINFLDHRMYRAILKSDYIILLHSVDPGHLGRRNLFLRRLLNSRKGKLIYFPRNEFIDFSLKRDFVRSTQVDVVASQLRTEIAQYLYGDLAQVAWMPHAVNLSIFKSTLPFDQRPIVIGGRTSQYPPTLLDNARNSVQDAVRVIAEKRPDWKIDYSVNTADRFDDRLSWANFLNRCRFTMTSEAGSAHVDKTDRTQHTIEKYVVEHPNATAFELQSTFAKEIHRLPSGKSITSRHFEAMGCKTCQVLIEGEYSGILQANKHYIRLKEDLSNLAEVLDKMQDTALCQQMIEESFVLVREQHTHTHRVEKLFELV